MIVNARFRGRPWFRWLNGVKKTCIAKSVALEDIKVINMDRE